MRCSQAELKILQCELDGRDPRQHASLRPHLERCADCAALVTSGPRLIGDLERSRDLSPPTVDLRARVTDEIGRLAPVRTQVPVGQLRWAAAAALLAVAAWIFGVGYRWGELESSVGATMAQLGGGWSGASPALTTAGVALVSMTSRLLGLVLNAITALGAAAAPLRPLGIGVGFAAFMIMSATIGYFVGRDLWRIQQYRSASSGRR